MQGVVGVDGYGCAVYPHGLELHRDGRIRRYGGLGWEYLLTPFPGKGGPRGAIAGFSRDSHKRLKWLLANAPIDFAVHVTLTYHARVDESVGEVVAKRNGDLVARSKADLKRFVMCVRNEAGAYCWIQEFQRRGAIHFHVLFEHALDAERAALAWCRATGQLHDPQALEHSVRVRRVDDQTAARRYLIKYFGKHAQKSLPLGVERAGRYWGASRSLHVEPIVQVVSCEQGGKLHDKAACRVSRGVRRFVSGVVGFDWRGGRLVRWDESLQMRVIRVLGELRRFYCELGHLVELAHSFGWEKSDDEMESRPGAPAESVGWRGRNEPEPVLGRFANGRQ